MFGFPIGNGNSGYNDFVEKFTNNADSGFPKIQQREVFYSVKDGNWNDLNSWQTASGRVGILPTLNDDVYIKHTISLNTNASVNNLFITATLKTDTTARTIFVYGNLQSIGTIDFSTNNANHNLYLIGQNNSIANLITGTGSTVTYGRNANSYYNLNGVTQAFEYGKQYILPLNYNNLVITNVGEKIATSDLVINGNLTIQATYSYGNFPGFPGADVGASYKTIPVMVMGDYNLTVNGNTTIGTFYNTGFTKTGPGTLLFKGTLSVSQISYVDLSGVTTIELRNGVSAWGFQGIYFWGTAQWRFTTNNQSITSTNGLVIYDAYIDNNIVVTNNTTLFITNILNGGNSNSKIINKGTINFTTQNAAENSMTIGQWDFTTFSNTIAYTGNYSATIPSLFTNFHNLTISGTGTKTLSVNTTLNGNLVINPNGTLECSTFNLSVLGTTTLGNDFGGSNVPVLSKNGAGNLLFVGQVLYIGANASFTGNPTIEYRGGLQLNQGQNSSNAYDFGTGNTSFTTNNQTITANRTIDFKGTTTIVGAIIVTVANAADFVRQTGTMNGTVAGSILNINGRYYINNISSPVPMTTGVFNHLNAATSIIGYVFNGNYTLPLTTYYGLTISGTGTKTLGGNTTTTSIVTIAGSSPTLELSTFNCTIGQMSGNFTTFTLSKNGAGNVIFTNGMSTTGNTWTLNFSGNPTVEVRNGLSNFTAASNFGTGQYTFTTNNQTLAQNSTFNCPLLISGAIILTINSNAITCNGVIDGNNASSTLRMAASSILTYRNATQPMATGILDTSTNLNTWIYGNANQDIKGDPTPLPGKQIYRNLTLNGGGTKTLQGYVSVQNTYTLTAPATLALNGFTLTNP